MQNITITGRIGTVDPIRRTQSGTAVQSWSVAVDQGWGEDKVTIWYRCALFGSRAEKLGRFLTKGEFISVGGPLTIETWQGKDGQPKTTNKVAAAQVTFCGGGGKVAQSNAANESTAADAPGDDDIPF